MQDGIGEKMSIFIYLITSFVAGIIMSFLNGWKLTLVVLSCAPVIIVAQSIVAKVLRNTFNSTIKYRGHLDHVFDSCLHKFYRT
jgi:ATP-binding cassette subfamily B (MDR/TAP) protein 1